MQSGATRSLCDYNSRQLSKEPTEGGWKADNERCILEGAGYALEEGLSPYPRHSIRAPLWDIGDANCVGVGDTFNPSLHLLFYWRGRPYYYSISDATGRHAWWFKPWQGQKVLSTAVIGTETVKYTNVTSILTWYRVWCLEIRINKVKTRNGAEWGFPDAVRLFNTLASAGLMFYRNWRTK